jgi:hypothetical protein
MVHSMYKFTYFHLGRKTSKWNDPGMKPLWWPKDVEYRNVNWGNNKPHVDELVKIMETFNTDYCRISNGNSIAVLKMIRKLGMMVMIMKVMTMVLTMMMMMMVLIIVIVMVVTVMMVIMIMIMIMMMVVFMVMVVV